MKNLLLFVLFLSSLVVHAQTPTWQAAIVAPQIAGSFCIVRATAADTAGNVYLAGSFIGQATFGSTTLNNTGRGLDDVFVAKWNTVSNQFVWALQAGGSGPTNTSADIAYSIAVSGNNVYVGGSFTSATATFGSVTLTKSITPTNYYNGFIAKITDTGASSSWTWAKRAGSEFMEVLGLAVNGPSVYATGWFTGFRSDFDQLLLSPANGNDMFVTKLTDAGSSANFIWAQRGGGFGDDRASAIAVTGSSIYVTGYFESQAATFGTHIVANSPSGGFDTFVAKLTEAGATASFAWALSATGSGGQEMAMALVAGPGGLYIAGDFSSASAQFGPFTLINAGVPSTSGLINSDVFVAKVTDAGTSGSFSWAQRAGGTDIDRATGLAVSQAQVYVGGYFSGIAAFGPTTLTSAGQSDVFVTKLTDAGAAASFSWAQRAGGSGYDQALGLSAQGQEVYVGGYLQSSMVNFGNTTVSANTGEYNIFGARLSDATALALTPTQLTKQGGIYPNPAGRSQEVTIQLPAKLTASQATLVLLNGLGQMVRTQTVGVGTGNMAKLATAGLPAGYYQMRVQVASQFVNYRLAIQ